MSSDFGSIFHYAGNVREMKLKIILSRISPSVGNNIESSSLVCDEVSCSWKELVTRKVHPNYERPEPRIFTQPIDDSSDTENLVHRKSSMSIYAFLGDLADTDETHFHDTLVCRITAFGGGKTLVFEPPVTTGGFRLEGKLGDYVARVQIFDDGFSSLTEDFSRMEMLDLPDVGVFDLSDENHVAVAYNICIETGVGFPFDAIALQWSILSQFMKKNSATSGYTGSFFPIKNKWHFSYTFSVNLNIPITDIALGITNPTILLEADSEDGWGRQWIAGYTMFTLPLTSGRTKETVHFWRPIDREPIAQLRDFFIGSHIELDSESFLRDGGRKMLGIQTESSGSIDIEITTLIHSRHFMAKDTLQHVKYGSRLGQLGLKSDLYWRIMKVLLEFEEARQMLLKARKM